MAFFVDMCTTDEKTTANEDEIEAEWAEEEDDDTDSSLAFMETEDVADIERNLTTSSFLHGRNLLPTRDSTLVTMHSHLNTTRH